MQATVIADRSGTELEVFVDDIQVSSEVARGLDSLNGFELYDLVALPARNVGVVVHVGQETLSILQSTGAVAQLATHAIQGKLNFNSARALATDKKHLQIREGDRVRVQMGANSGKEGTIRRIHRTFLFVHISQEQVRFLLPLPPPPPSSDVSHTRAHPTRLSTHACSSSSTSFLPPRAHPTRLSTHACSLYSLAVQSNNSGISVVRARGVERLGGTAGGDVQSSSGVVISSSSVAQHSGMQRRRGGANDDIVGKMVKIIKGNMKGYLGRVVSANSTKARVKFQSKPRPLAFALSHIQRVDDDELSEKGRARRRRAAAGSATASSAYGAGSLTPMIGNMGSFTPGHEVGTPMGGSSTPYLSNTPGVGGTPRSASYAASDSSEAWDPAVTGTPLLAAQEAERLTASMQNLPGDALSVAGGVSSAYSVSTGVSSAYSVSGVDSQSESGGGVTPAFSENSSYGSYISSTSEWESSQAGGGSSAAPSGASSVAGSTNSRWGQAAPPPAAPLAADTSGPSYNAAYNWIQRGLVLNGTSSEGEQVTGSVVGRENNICRVRTAA